MQFRRSTRMPDNPLSRSPSAEAMLDRIRRIQSGAGRASPSGRGEKQQLDEAALPPNAPDTVENAFRLISARGRKMPNRGLIDLSSVTDALGRTISE